MAYRCCLILRAKCLVTSEWMERSGPVVAVVVAVVMICEGSFLSSSRYQVLYASL